MKTIMSRIILAYFLIGFMAVISFGQGKTSELKDKKPLRLEKTNVPMEVTETFVREHPAPAYDYWYGYPAFENEYDWYGYNPYRYSYDNPEYYIVEFSEKDVPHKAIYSKTGAKISTHKKLNTVLPKGITSAIGKSEYKTWKLLKDKEEIFKDEDADEMKVYKVEVEKGKEKHILFYLADGKLLKDKEIKKM